MVQRNKFIDVVFKSTNATCHLKALLKYLFNGKNAVRPFLLRQINMGPFSNP